jgi:hypothetical protein
MDRGEIRFSGMGWNFLAEDRDWWRAFVNMVMNLRVLLKLEHFSVAAQLVAFQQGFSSMELVS